MMAGFNRGTQAAAPDRDVRSVIKELLDAARLDTIKECIVTLKKSYPDHAWLNAACAALRQLASEPTQ